MEAADWAETISDIIQELDGEVGQGRGRNGRQFTHGIGPYMESQQVSQICRKIDVRDGLSCTAGYRYREGDVINKKGDFFYRDNENDESWVGEFKLYRPFGDNGQYMESWNKLFMGPFEVVNPQNWNKTSYGDIHKLRNGVPRDIRKFICWIGYELEDMQQVSWTRDQNIELFESGVRHHFSPNIREIISDKSLIEFELNVHQYHRRGFVCVWEVLSSIQ